MKALRGLLLRPGFPGSARPFRPECPGYGLYYEIGGRRLASDGQDFASQLLGK